MTIERTKTENPFTLGVQPGRPKYQPDLQSRVPSRASFDKAPVSGTYIADALVKFAGAAGNEYIKATAKKVEIDKAIQTARAVQGLTPTDDATTAGYRAHAVIKANTEIMAGSMRLKDLAKQNLNDEDWEQSIRDEALALDKTMMSTYSNYEKDEELQKLISVLFRENMPQVSLYREQAKMENEIQERMNSAVDAISNIFKGNGTDDTNAAGTAGAAQAMSTTANEYLKSLKLTDAERESVVVQAVLASNSKLSIDFAKEYKGARSTSLYARSAKIQRYEKQLQIKERKLKGYNNIKEKRQIISSLMDGTLDGGVDAFIEWAKTNQNMSVSEVESYLNKKDVMDAKRFKSEQLQKALDNPTSHAAPNTTSKEYQDALALKFHRNIEYELKEKGVDKMEDAEARESVIADVISKNVREITNSAVAEGTVFNPIVDNMKMFANADTKLLREQTAGTAGTVGTAGTEMTKKFKQSVSDFQSMSLSSQQAHLAKLSAYEAEVWRTGLGLIDSGVPYVQAFESAQRTAKVPKAYKAEPVQKAVKKVISNLGAWFKSNVPDFQHQYINEKIRAEISRADDPEADSNIDRVTANFETRSFRSDGVFYVGDKKEIAKLTGLNTDKLTGAFEYIMMASGMKDKIIAASKHFGFNPDNVFAEVDANTKTFQFRSPDGSWLSASYPLNNLRKMQRQAKVEREQDSTDQFDTYWSEKHGSTGVDKDLLNKDF